MSMLWEEIIKQIEQEEDSGRVAELAQKLNDAMLAEERERVRRRLGILTDRRATVRSLRGVA